MDEQMQQLIEQRNLIEEEIKKRKIINKMESIKGTNLSSILRRMSTKFFDEMEDINKKREGNNLKGFSHPKITGLITSHDGWNKIKGDIINYEINMGGDHHE